MAYPGWISPEGEYFSLKNVGSHADWAEEFLVDSGLMSRAKASNLRRDTDDAVCGVLMDYGWIRQAGDNVFSCIPEKEEDLISYVKSNYPRVVAISVDLYRGDKFLKSVDINLVNLESIRQVVKRLLL